MNEIHEELKPWLEHDARYLGLITPQPRGMRDLMWCPHINEPMILEYRDGRPYCRGCGNGNVSSFEAETHVFMGHVCKP